VREAGSTFRGLSSVHDAAVGESGPDYVYSFDGNGNVGQVVDWTRAGPPARVQSVDGALNHSGEDAGRANPGSDGR
jgi:hypothetical protein